MNFTNIEALKNLITNNQLLNTTETNNTQGNAATETMDLSASDYSVANNAVYATGAKGETFDPNTRVTKGEVALSLYTADGSPDVTVPAGYSKVDAWAKSSGLFGDSYNSNDPITNEEMVNLLRNYAGHRGFDTQGYINLGDYYSDGTGINSNNIDAYTWAVDNQIYTGASLNPSGIVSRGDFSNMLSAFDNAYSAELGLVPINNINTNIPNIAPINGNVGINTSTDAVQTGQTNVPTETADISGAATAGTTVNPQTGANSAEQTAMQNNFLQNLLNMFNGLGANNNQSSTTTGVVQNTGASATNTATNTTTSKYTDVRQADMEAVNYVSDRGLMVGTSATTFNPDAGVTRAQMVQILYSMSGSPSNVGGTSSYSDVANGEWYSNAVAWAQNTGLVGGYDDGTFRPNQVLTSEQAAAIFKKYAEQSGKNTSTIKQINNPVNYNSLGGTNNVSNYAQDAVKWAVRDGMIDTSSGSINPKKELTRAEFARYLMNYDINYNGGAGKSNYNVTAKQNTGTLTSSTTTSATQNTSSGSTNLLDPNYWTELLRKFPTTTNKESTQGIRNDPTFVKDPETGLYPNGTKSGVKWLNYDSSWSDNFNNSMAAANSSISAGKASASAAASSGSKVANSGLSNIDFNMNYTAPKTVDAISSAQTNDTPSPGTYAKKVLSGDSSANWSQDTIMGRFLSGVEKNVQNNTSNTQKTINGEYNNSTSPSDQWNNIMNIFQ